MAFDNIKIGRAIGFLALLFFLVLAAGVIWSYDKQRGTQDNIITTTRSIRTITISPRSSITYSTTSIVQYITGYLRLQLDRERYSVGDTAVMTIFPVRAECFQTNHAVDVYVYAPSGLLEGRYYLDMVYNLPVTVQHQFQQRGQYRILLWGTHWHLTRFPSLDDVKIVTVT